MAPPLLPKGQRRKLPLYQRLQRFVLSLDAAAAFALSFEVLTAALSVVDVVADILVAKQFYDTGHTVWASAVVASLFISSVAYTMFFCNDILCIDPVFRQCFAGGRPTFHDWSEPQKVKVYVIVFVFAQFLPTAVWVAGFLHEHDLFFTWIEKNPCADAATKADHGWATLSAGPGALPSSASAAGQVARPSDSHGDARGGHAPEPCHAALEEEVEQSRHGATLMRRVHSTMEHHLRTHTLFYVETVAEAVPQALIQLLAMTYAGTNEGGPTPLQLFSLGMSLLTICSKAYLVSLSFDIHAFIFKAALAVHDLFSLFHIYSTILAPRHEDSWSFDPLGIGIEFGLVSTVWLLRLVAGVALVLVVFALIANDNAASFQLKWSEVRSFGTLTMAFTVGFVPALIVLDATKLSWLCFLDAASLPATNVFPSFSALLSFVRKGRTPEEVHERVMHVAHASATHDRRHNTGLKARTGANQQWYRGYLSDKIEVNEIVAALTSGPGMIERSEPWRVRVASKSNPKGSLTDALVHMMVRDGGTRRSEHIVVLALCSVAVFYAATQAMMLLFPLLNVAVEGVRHQNALQLFSAGICIACLAVAGLMWPLVSPYAQFVAAVVVDHDRAYSSNSDFLPEALDTIRAFVVPTAPAVVTAVTPHCVVSRAVSEFVVGPYLPSTAVDMARLSSAECRALRLAFHGDDA